MICRPSVSATLAMKAAAARDDEPEEIPAPASELEPDAQGETHPLLTKAVGRPKGHRAVAALQAVCLGDARHAALAWIAEDRGRSILSLILEGIDHAIGTPTALGW